MSSISDGRKVTSKFKGNPHLAAWCQAAFSSFTWFVFSPFVDFRRFNLVFSLTPAFFLNNIRTLTREDLDFQSSRLAYPVVTHTH